jgi:hypothetical protein
VSVPHLLRRRLPRILTTQHSQFGQFYDNGPNRSQSTTGYLHCLNLQPTINMSIGNIFFAKHPSMGEYHLVSVFNYGIQYLKKNYLNESLADF